MNHDITEYVTNCHQYPVTKGHTGLQIQWGSLVANNPLDLLCIDFLQVDPSRESKENIWVLTDIFTKFSQAFITNNQKSQDNPVTSDSSIKGPKFDPKL